MFKILIVTVISLTYISSAIAENDSLKIKKDTIINSDPQVTDDSATFKHRIDQSTEVYNSFIANKNTHISKETLQKANCIAIFPRVITGAFVLGGTHGEGLASCKNTSGNWSQPAPIALTQGSIGLQAGAKSSDLVVLFLNNQSVADLKHGEFEMNSDVSAIAGENNINFDKTNTGVIIFSDTQGAFAGASVLGGKIAEDTKEISKYYGQKADYLTLLDGKKLPEKDNYSQKLTTLLPKV